MKTLAAAALAITLAGVGPVGRAGAAPPGVPAIEAPSAASTTDARLTSMEQRLALDDRRFRRWRWGWLLTYGGLTVGNLALVPMVAHRDRIDYYTGAATSAFGTLTMALGAPPPSIDVACPEERDERAACVERRYREVGAAQRQSRGWLAHTINFAFNAGVSAFLALGYGRWGSAAANLAVGTAIGELQIATQPSAVLRGSDEPP